MKEKLIINKKSLKGEDGYKTFSIRIKDETVVNLDKLAEETNRSRNELINILLDYAIENSEVNKNTTRLGGVLLWCIKSIYYFFVIKSQFFYSNFIRG